VQPAYAGSDDREVDTCTVLLDLAGSVLIDKLVVVVYRLERLAYVPFP
jgi:hypothetical protein